MTCLLLAGQLIANIHMHDMSSGEPDEQCLICERTVLHDVLPGSGFAAPVFITTNALLPEYLQLTPVFVLLSHSRDPPPFFS
jgi:hypothetical protein